MQFHCQLILQEAVHCGQETFFVRLAHLFPHTTTNLSVENRPRWHLQTHERREAQRLMQHRCET
jgi:hypothetical protein